MKHATSNIPFRLAPLAAAGLLLLATAPARAAVIEVGLGPNDCTLVDAVTAANTDAAQGSCPAGNGADDIVLPAGAEFVLLDGPFENGTSSNRNALRVNSDIRILGNGSTLRGADPSRLRLIRQDSGTLILEDLTLTGGTAAAGGSAGGLHTTGDAQTTLRRCTVRGNSGGLSAFNNADLTLIDSTVADNVLRNEIEPGLRFNSAGTLRVEGSVFRDNILPGATGGALQASTGTILIQRSSFSGNRAGEGGGIFVGVAASFTMTDSSVVDNEAGADGGGLTIANTDQVHLSRNLIAGNRAPEGTGREMAIALNGAVVSGGYNLIGVEGDAGLDLSAFGLQSDFVPVATDITPAQSLDGIIAGLADNGGPTATHALAANSPAIDAIPGELCGGDANALDQRGVARPQGAGCDIGAFEAGLLATALDADAVATVIVRKGLRVSAKTSPSATLLDLANGQPLAGQTVKFSAGSTALCEAQTDANGVASCTATLGGLLGNVLNGGYTATFEGTAQFEGSSAQGALLKH